MAGGNTLSQSLMSVRERNQESRFGQERENQISNKPGNVATTVWDRADTSPPGTRRNPHMTQSTIKCNTLVLSVLAALTVMVSACATIPRPTPPAAGAQLAQPWGSVPLRAADGEIDQNITDSFIKSLQAKRDALRQTGVAGKTPYRALTLSGGGSRGAYGAGVLSGWTVRGDRPQFDVVTGISTGALMATHAFLGPEFDNDLAIYKTISNDDVFRKRRILAALRGTSALDTAPLRKTLLSVITEETLDFVAAEYRKGRRLFIATTNLDANVFAIWDMGAIAASARPDRLKRYIDVVMASAAFPIAFPPIYIEVDDEGGAYTEMHADGGVRETVFFFDFDLIKQVRRAMDAAGISESDFKQELYLLINGPIASAEVKTYKPVDGKIGSIADATITSLMTKVTQGSVYRMWVLAMVHGADFHLSFVPPGFEFTSGSLTFDPKEQTALFELGYQQALDGTAWATQRAPNSTEELIQRILDPASSFNGYEPPAWLKREH